MPYNLEQCFVDHTSELEQGFFVNPETQEIGELTAMVRYLVMCMLLRLPGDPDESDPHAIARGNKYFISAKWVSDCAGIRVHTDTYAKLVRQTTQAGIFVWTREPGGNYSITGGVTLRCEHFTELGLCDPKRHDPSWYKRSIKPSTNSIKPSTNSINESQLLGEIDSPALVHLDKNNRNNFNNQEQTLNTGLGVSETKELELETLENLPGNYQAWAWARSKKREQGSPSSMDIAEAWRCYELTGVDLEPGGLWLDGRPNPLTGSKHN